MSPLRPLRAVRRIRFDVWEVLLLLALLFAALHPFRRDVSTYEKELPLFAERYGPDHQTERHEEWFIRDFFDGRRGGFFVDVGANHPKRFNKTWYLEKELGWSGIAIEPLKEFEEAWRAERPNTRFLPFFVSDASDAQARLYVISGNTLVASGHPSFTNQYGSVDRVDTVPTITLNDVMARERVERIDFLSMDIELHEPEALRAFDLSLYRPSLVCIEALLPVRQQILNHFAANGYVAVGKYLRVDQENLYFAPLDSPAVAHASN